MSEKRGCKICHCSKIKVCKRGKGGKRKNESAKNNKAKEIDKVCKQKTSKTKNFIF